MSRRVTGIGIQYFIPHIYGWSAGFGFFAHTLSSTFYHPRVHPRCVTAKNRFAIIVASGLRSADTKHNLTPYRTRRWPVRLPPFPLGYRFCCRGIAPECVNQAVSNAAVRSLCLGHGLITYVKYILGVWRRAERGYAIQTSDGAYLRSFDNGKWPLVESNGYLCLAVTIG